MYIDFPEVTGVTVEGAEDISLPPMVRVRQKYDKSHIGSVEVYLKEKLERTFSAMPDFSGKRICITAGSRGIPDFDSILRVLCGWLKGRGAIPFIIPAMGSHGGASAEGQKKILEGYNITEESVGAPILSSMETVEYGRLSNGTPLYCDKHAFESDGIVLLNKQKPHTDFRGEYESGIAKMAAIGIAKHKGATSFHRQGFHEFGKKIPEAFEVFLKRAPVFFGVGVVQNAYDQICALDVALPDRMMEMDRQNLKIAKQCLPVFKFKELDVLVVDEIGKDISGFGHDPNVTGRSNGFNENFSNILHMQNMVVLGLTKASEGNATGISEADVTTLRCMRGIDWSAVWTNQITSAMLQGCKMPMYANNDREAVLLAIHGCVGVDRHRIRLARIRNTLELHEILVSHALYEDVKENPDIEFLEESGWQFDESGNLSNL